MKKKSVLALFLAVALTVMLAVPAMAAGVDDVQAELQRLLEKYAGNAKLEKLIDDAQMWLADPVNAASITEDVAASISSEIQSAEAIAGDALSLSSLDKAQTEQIITNITQAAGAVGLKFEADASNTTFVLKDEGGNEISRLETGNPIKQTGFAPDWSGLVPAGVMLVILAVLAVIFRRQPKRVRETA